MLFEIEELKEKVKTTKLKRYGDSGYVNREKQRKTNLRKYGVENPFSSKLLQRKIIATNLKRYGCKNPSQNLEIRRKSRRKYWYDNQQFDSSWEVAFYIFHQDKKTKKFIHEPGKLEYYDLTGKKRAYFPDFKIGRKYFEIKGGQFFDKDGNPKEKFKAKYEFIRKNNIILLTKSEMIPYFEYCRDKFGLSSAYSAITYIRKNFRK